MLNPARTIVFTLLVLAGAGIVLGLATDVGLFGWTFGLAALLYLGLAGIAHLARRRSRAAGKPA